MVNFACSVRPLQKKLPYKTYNFQYDSALQYVLIYMYDPKYDPKNNWYTYMYNVYIYTYICK